MAEKRADERAEIVFGDEQLEPFAVGFHRNRREPRERNDRGDGKDCDRAHGPCDTEHLPRGKGCGKLIEDAPQVGWTSEPVSHRLTIHCQQEKTQRRGRQQEADRPLGQDGQSKETRRWRRMSATNWADTRRRRVRRASLRTMAHRTLSIVGRLADPLRRCPGLVHPTVLAKLRPLCENEHHERGQEGQGRIDRRRPPKR